MIVTKLNVLQESRYLTCCLNPPEHLHSTASGSLQEIDDLVMIEHPKNLTNDSTVLALNMFSKLLDHSIIMACSVVSHIC